MNLNIGGGISCKIYKQLLNVMEKQDELNPLTEQFMMNLKAIHFKVYMHF